MLQPCEEFYQNITADATIMAFIWWAWVAHAPPHTRPAPVIESYWQSYVEPIFDALKSGLREPSCTFNTYVLLCLTITITSSFVTYGLSRFFARFSPIQYSAWVDWAFPPKTIVHEVQSADGKVKRNANEFRDIFTMGSFLLDKAHLATDNPHKYAARRRLAAVNMAQAVAKRLGLTIHDEQMSRRSARRGQKGSRTLMSAKDACSYVADDLRFEKTKSGSLVTHIDTFTHKDLRDANATLSDGNIHFLYTWNPDCVAGQSDETQFRYDEDGNFVTEVEGSAPYYDQLWDFEDDSLVTHSYEMSAGFITTISLFTALSVFCYNFYINYAINYTYHNLGAFYMKTFVFQLPYPAASVCTFTNFVGHVAALIHATSGLPTSWFAALEGVRYPYIAIRYLPITYPWIVQLQALTFEHWLTIFILLFLALAGSYTPISVSHKVIRLDVGEHRSIVVIVPNCKFRGYAASFRPFLSNADLRPRTPTVGITEGGHKFLAEKRKKPSGFSIAFLDSFESHFIKDTVNDMTKSLTTDKASPSLSNVRASSKNEGDVVHRVAVALAIAVATKGSVIPRYSSNYGFYPLPTIIRQDDESKADGVPIKEVMAHGAMPPVVSGGAFIHARSEAQTKDFVKRRLKEPATKIDSTINPEMATHISEFAEHIRREVGGNAGYNHPLDPISEQDYIDSRNKNQLTKFHDIKAIYDIHNHEDRQGFMKREVLIDPTKAARGICTFPPASQAMGGRISLAYAAAMKACPWMACGLNPIETQEAVVRVCAGATSVTDTDFSAQDATIDYSKRCIELMLLLQLFDEDWHETIKDWHYTDYCGRVLYGDKGTKREPHEFEGSRGSGSPFTTLGNTPLTGLFAFTALRLSGKTSEEAWSGLGIYSGDDGITADLPPASCDQASEALGFLVKSSTGDKYIPFLGRHYFDPIGGSYSSIQSPLRTASKLHTTLLNIEEFTAEETIIMKAICLQVTDKDSDFFGAWSKKILEDAKKKQANCVQNLGAKILKYPGLHPYFAITALNSQTTFHNCQGDFEELFEIEMPGFDWSRFKAWVKDGEGPCPLLWEHPEPTDEAMETVGPVTLAMGGVNDQANMVDYEAPGKQKNKVTFAQDTKLSSEFIGWLGTGSSRGHARTKRAHQDFVRLIEEIGLLEQYRAARNVTTDTPVVKKEKRRTRQQIEDKVKLVHKPRSN